jgi:hypothetical protein
MSGRGRSEHRQAAGAAEPLFVCLRVGPLRGMGLRRPR